MLIYTLYKGGGMSSYTPYIYICTYPYIPTIYGCLWAHPTMGPRCKGGTGGYPYLYMPSRYGYTRGKQYVRNILRLWTGYV